MMKKYLWVSIIIFLSILTSVADSATIFTDLSLYSEPDNNSPSYSVIPRPSTITTNLGKPVNVDIYIAGLGNIKNNKIMFYFPTDLLNSENPGQIGATIGCKNNRPIFIDNNVTLGNVSVGKSLSPCNFMYDPENLMILSEMRNGLEPLPPIYLIMNISDKATPGDKDVAIVFTYTDGTKWYQDREKITIHVNNPIEENRQYLFIASAILGIILTCISVDDKFKKYLSSRRGIAILILISALIAIILFYVFISL